MVGKGLRGVRVLTDRALPGSHSDGATRNGIYPSGPSGSDGVVRALSHWRPDDGRQGVEWHGVHLVAEWEPDAGAPKEIQLDDLLSFAERSLYV